MVRVLKSKRGTAFPYAVMVVMGVLLMVAVIVQIGTLYLVTAGVRNEVQADLINDVQDNYTSVYYGNRESNTAGYTPDGSGDWTDTTDTDGFYADLQQNLGLDNAMEKVDANGNIHYQITDIQIHQSNPDVGGTSTHYLESVTYTLKIPVMLAGNMLPDFSIDQTVKAGEINKF